LCIWYDWQLKVPDVRADSDDELVLENANPSNNDDIFEYADDYVDENGFHPLPHNPTQSFHSSPMVQAHADIDDSSFMDRIAQRLQDASGSVPYPSVLREFGGNGDCGPASLSGVMNFFGIDGYGERLTGGPMQLRRIIVDLARGRPDIIHTLNERWQESFPDGIEVRESSGLRTIHTVNDYLDHMLLEGSHFDEPAWQIAALAFNLTIVMHRVSSFYLLVI
jgi:hypothetical protein